MAKVKRTVKDKPVKKPKSAKKKRNEGERGNTSYGSFSDDGQGITWNHPSSFELDESN